MIDFKPMLTFGKDRVLKCLYDGKWWLILVFNFLILWSKHLKSPPLHQSSQTELSAMLNFM